MKKIVACLVAVCFFVAAMPRPAHAGNGSKLAAIGIVSGLVAGLVWLSGRRDEKIVKNNNKTQNKMHQREEATARLLGAPKAMGRPGVVQASGGGIEDGKVSWNTYPPQPKTLKQAKKYGFLGSPLPPSNGSHSSHSGGESALYRAGARAARNGVKMACDDNANDYCRGYNAVKEGR